MPTVAVIHAKTPKKKSSRRIEEDHLDSHAGLRALTAWHGKKRYPHTGGAIKSSDAEMFVRLIQAASAFDRPFPDTQRADNEI